MKKRLKESKEALEVETFPMDKEGINYAVGDLEVAGPAGKESSPIRDLTDELKQEKFASAKQIVDGLADTLKK